MRAKIVTVLSHKNRGAALWMLTFCSPSPRGLRNKQASKLHGPQTEAVLYGASLFG